MRRLRVFIFTFSFVWVALHCPTRLLYLSYPGQPETPQQSALPRAKPEVTLPDFRRKHRAWQRNLLQSEERVPRVQN
jgi:hypothetical protein